MCNTNLGHFSPKIASAANKFSYVRYQFKLIDIIMNLSLQNSLGVRLAKFYDKYASTQIAILTCSKPCIASLQTCSKFSMTSLQVHDKFAAS